MIPHKIPGSGISGAVRYVMGEGKRDRATGAVPKLAPGEQSRVAWYGGTGFGFAIDSETRLDIARRVMEWAAQNQASKTKKCKDDCLHLVLSWDGDEQPTRAEMEAAAHSALDCMGMGHARAIFAAHGDTAHAHLHLVISRIDPKTGLTFRDSFDTRSLSAWALEWEQAHGGVRCQARLDTRQSQVERNPEKLVDALMARRETFTVFDINRELRQAIVTADTRRAYIADLLKRPDIVALADPDSGRVTRYTTRQTLAAEHLAEASAGRLHGDATHAVSDLALYGVTEALRAKGNPLRQDQADALRFATRSEGLSVIAGKAGTGKTFTMAAIAAAYEAEGYVAQSLAPSNKVAAALRRDGLEAATLHSMVGRLDRGEAIWTDRTLVMMDEVGMVSTRLMARLLSHAEHAGAKVILLGDEKQLASIERGGMFGYLAERHGMAELIEVIRQRGAEQRALAVRASRYDFQTALTALEAQGDVVTVERLADRVAAAAAAWKAKSAAAPGSSLFVIAVSNADVDALNRTVRAIRRERGELGPDHTLAAAGGPQAFAVADPILFNGSALSRADRAKGLINGNSGTIARIEGGRVSVALDGARPGELVSFTVGRNREAGEFDAIRHGYAGTIYKSQGATYDHAIVVDSPGMRASGAYVALTRHRDSVTVVTAREMRPGFDGWTAQRDGFAALTPDQQDSAIKAYAQWRDAADPKVGRQHGLEGYVADVQAKADERQVPDLDVAAMAKRWSRVDDRRAASRFEAQNYRTPPAGKKLTPAEVRALVGVETFERDQGQGAARAPKETRMDQETPSETLFRRQVEEEAERLRILGEQEDRAKAYRQAKQREAEEAQKRKKR